NPFKATNIRDYIRDLRWDVGQPILAAAAFRGGSALDHWNGSRCKAEPSLDTARRSACATSATNLAPHGSCSFLIDSGKPGDIRRSENGCHIPLLIDHQDARRVTGSWFASH